jgi:hypothetical protein
MDNESLLTHLWGSFKSNVEQTLVKLNLRNEAAATTIPMDRPLSEAEYAIAKWALLHADPPATSFVPQLDVARVIGGCSCGCPTVDFKIPEGTPREEPRDNPVGDAIGEVNGMMVGVMVMQTAGYLTCLEIYDLSDIEHPYGLPSLESLRPFEAAPKTD